MRELVYDKSKAGKGQVSWKNENAIKKIGE